MCALSCWQAGGANRLPPASVGCTQSAQRLTLAFSQHRIALPQPRCLHPQAAPASACTWGGSAQPPVCGPGPLAAAQPGGGGAGALPRADHCCWRLCTTPATVFSATGSCWQAPGQTGGGEQL